MDIITILDIAAVVLAYFVMVKGGTGESVLLFTFFATTSFISFHIFKTDAYVLWPMLFTAIIVIFGLMSFCHVVVLGYIAQLVVVGLNMKHEVFGYSFLIYAIFLAQLLAVRYGHTFSYYRSRFSRPPRSGTHA